MRLQLVTALEVVYLANFSVAIPSGVTSSKNSVETKKIRGLMSFEDADPKPLDGSRHTANLSASEEERFGMAAVAARTGGGAPASYPTYTPPPAESASSNSEDDDDGFWESFKDWLFDDDSS